MHYLVLKPKVSTNDDLIEEYIDILCAGLNANKMGLQVCDYLSLVNAAKWFANGKSESTLKVEKGLIKELKALLDRLPNTTDHPFFLNKRVDRHSAEIFLCISH